MDTRGQSRAVEAQTEHEDQTQLAIAAEIAELRQAVQQQAELMQKLWRLGKEKMSLHAVKTSCLRHLYNGFQIPKMGIDQVRWLSVYNSLITYRDIH